MATGESIRLRESIIQRVLLTYCCFLMIFFYLKGFGITKYRTAESKKILMKMTRASFLFSTFIELCQLFLRLGTFQLSNIFQNTLGGLMGAVLFVILNNRK